MRKLFTLGCSLTYPYGWKDVLAKAMGYKVVNSAMYAGSNDLQVRRMHNLIVNQQVSEDDVIIWQVTGQVRHSYSIAPDEQAVRKLELSKPVPPDERFKDTEYYIRSPINYFDGNEHIDVLSNHPMITNASNYYDFAQSLEEMLSTMILLNNSYKILVLVGWPGALDECEQNFKKFLQALSDNNVPHMPETMLDWVIRNNYKLDEDDLHPTLEASEAYAIDALYPKLKELGWV